MQNWIRSLADAWQPDRNNPDHGGGLEFQMALVVFTAGTVSTVNLILAPNPLRVAMGSLLMVAVLGSRMLLHYGRPRAAAWTFLLSLWLSIAASSLFSGGVLSPIFTGMVYVLILAVGLRGWTAGGGLLLVTVIWAGAMAWATSSGLFWFPVYRYHPYSWVLILLAAAASLTSFYRKSRATAARAGGFARFDRVETIDEHFPVQADIRPYGDVLTALVAGMADGVAAITTSDEILIANRAFAEMVDYPMVEIAGRKFIDFVLAEDRAAYRSPRETSASRARTDVLQLVRKDRVILMVEVQDVEVPAEAADSEVIFRIVRDITGRAETAVALRDSEQRLNAFFENTEDAVFLKDLDGCYSMINPAGAEMFRRPTAEILFRDDVFLFSPADARRITALDKRVIEAGERLSDEAEYTVRGELRVFLTTRGPYYGSNGKISGIVGIVRDVTDRRRVEAELRAIERRYRALFESNTDGVLILDLDGIILDMSGRASAMLGYSLEDLVGRHFEGLIDVGDLPVHRQAFKSLVAGEGTQFYERGLLRKNGATLQVEISAGIVAGEDGRPNLVQMLLRDIGERSRVDQERTALLNNLRERTSQIRTAFEVSKSVASTLDLEKLLNQTVETIKRRFGFYYVGIFLQSDGWAHLLAGSGKQGKQMLAAGHKLAIGEGSMIGWCIENRRARLAAEVEKEEVHFNNPFTPKTRSELALPLIVHGEAIGALTVQSEYPAAFNSEDVAVLQIMADQLAIAVQNASLHEKLTAYAEELEDRVRERTTQLEAANQELESFSYSISHDLRTPLRAVHGYSGILLEEHAQALPASTQEYLHKIHINALRMGELIDDILAFSRTGRTQLKKTECDPNAIVREVFEEFQSQVDGRRIEITADPLPVVQADRALLKQVFANLVGNAIKFTQNRDLAFVRISYGQTPRGGAFRVQDNGVGFDMKFSDRLFGVFQRLHRTDEFEGTGVGLAIVHRIIERHGGEIWFEAEEGAGATFYFRLPD